MASGSIRAFTENVVDPHVRGFLHVPENGNNDGLVLTHGAGGNAGGRLLVALAEAFTGTGFTVMRCDLPYRQRRSYGPPGPGDAARDRAGLKNSVAAMQKMVSSRLFLGGQSYGGRQASMLCAEEPELVAGLLLLSYPLHPPGKPQQLRTQHLTDLRTPTLVVQGTSDPFGSTDEIKQALKLINAKTRLLPVDDVGHDLGFKGKAKREGLPTQVLSEFEIFFHQLSS